MLTEHYDDEWAYFRVVVFGTVQMQNHVAHDFQLNLAIDVAVPYFLHMNSFI